MKTNVRGLAGGLLLVFAVSAFPLRAATAEPAPATASVAVGENLPAVHDLLVRAIREKRVIRFTYRGHARVVEPHAYGRNTKGEPVLHAFQTEGGSASRPPPGWRTFAAASIESAELGESTFKEARDGYSPNELHLTPLWAEVPALVVEE